MSEPNTKTSELQSLYRQRFDSHTAYRNAVWQTLIRSYFQRLVPANAAILDLGCGYGEFINNVQAGRKYGMDLNPESPAHLAAEVQFFAQDCSQPWPLAEGTLDVVFTSNFFEHLPDKPTLRRTLQEAHRCLRPGGLLIALGPNIRRTPPGAYWDFWDHTLCLTDRSLAEGMSTVGFEIRTKLDSFLPYTMSGTARRPQWMIKLYLALPILWRFFGHQFLVVGRKPAA